MYQDGVHHVMEGEQFCPTGKFWTGCPDDCRDMCKALKQGIIPKKRKE